MVFVLIKKVVLTLFASSSFFFFFGFGQVYWRTEVRNLLPMESRTFAIANRDFRKLMNAVQVENTSIAACCSKQGLAHLRYICSVGLTIAHQLHESAGTEPTQCVVCPMSYVTLIKILYTCLMILIFEETGVFLLLMNHCSSLPAFENHYIFS